MSDDISNFIVGTYIDDSKQSVYRGELDGVREKISIELDGMNAGICTSFIIKGKNGIYAVNELEHTIHGRYSEVVFFREKKKNIFEFHSKCGTQGDYACHLTLSVDEKLLFVTNYGGSIVAISLDDDGGVSKLVQEICHKGNGIYLDRQEKSHPHQSMISPCGTYLFVTDLGCDKIYIYQITDIENPFIHKRIIDMPEGTGPRHMTWSCDNKTLYVCGELSSSVLVFLYDENQIDIFLKQEISMYEPETNFYHKNTSSEIIAFKNNVYVSNRGKDEIVVFRIEDGGFLTHIANYSSGGRIPRNFNIIRTRCGDYLLVANQESNNIVMFKIIGERLVYMRECQDIKKPVVICKL